MQAVGFRASCARRAVEAGVGGWVRNTDDGKLEAAFEGPGPVVDRLVVWCEDGPPMARVDTLTVTDEPPTGETSFVVR